MDTRELARRLFEEGCNPAIYAIGERGGASDAFCLTRTGDEWQVYYTERGHDSPPMFATASEEEACAYFLAHMRSIRHDHCVGFFRAREGAVALLGRLEALGLAPWADQIPYGGPGDPRFRVFVSGTAVFAARAELGAIPARDEDA